jgi:S-DNA-T family DNA segregation ATPase FtsK/SpoIIIE
MFAASDAADSGFGEDPLYEQAKKIVIEARKASASFLQRRLRIGYSRAARLIDILEERGVVGAGDGAKPRDILASADDGATAMPVEPDKGGQDGSWSKV